MAFGDRIVADFQSILPGREVVILSEVETLKRWESRGRDCQGGAGGGTGIMLSEYGGLIARHSR